VASLINVCAWLASLFPERAQQDVWGDNRDAWVAGSLAPHGDAKAVDGGWRVTGKWMWASGSLHAQWAACGIHMNDENGDTVNFGLSLMPMSELTIEDTWFVAGMKGTGSNTMVAERVFVPEHRYASVPAAINGHYRTEHTDEALYRSALLPVLALILVGPLLGLGRAALKIAVEKAPKRAVSYTRLATQTESTAFQLKLAEAAMTLDDGILHAHRGADDIDRWAASGEYMDYVGRARVRADTGWTSKRVREAISLILDAHGASGFADSSPMQRIWRDANTGGRHAIVNTLVNEELYGKALLGIGPEGQVTDLV
jgi:alkylation response protein AidB-like acyl-CoA dehydrogenase